MRYFLFCDESGNSGSNALNKDDPFYIHMGWLIHEDKVNKVRDILMSYRRNRNELKSTKILRKAAGQKELARLIKELLNNNCVPIITILEYRFSIAMRIIEFLFDPEYNKSVPYDFEEDFIIKKVFASIAYEYDDKILERFFEGYRNFNIQALKESILCMQKYNVDIEKVFPFVEEYVEHRDKLEQYYKLFNCFLESSILNLDSNILAVKETAENSENNVMMSLNLPMFAVFVQNIQNLCLENNIKVTIVHDKSLEFEKGYRRVIDLYTKNDWGATITYNDASKLIISNEFIDNVDFQESKDEICIQASDIFAGSLNRCLKKDVEQELYDLVVPFIFAFLDSKLVLCNPRISRPKQHGIFEKIKNFDQVRLFYNSLVL